MPGLPSAGPHLSAGAPVSDGTVGAVTRKLRETLVGMQRGLHAESYGWLRAIA